MGMHVNAALKASDVGAGNRTHSGTLQEQHALLPAETPLQPHLKISVFIFGNIFIRNYCIKLWALL